jgi:PAS domain S-box-containing protein
MSSRSSSTTVTGAGKREAPPSSAGADAFRALTVQQFLDSLPSVALVFDDTLCIVAANRAAAQFLGYNAAQSIGKPLEGVLRLIYNRAVGPLAAEGDLTFDHHFDGSWYAVRVFPLQTAAGQPSLRCLTATDISARKTTEFEWRESEARFEEATRIVKFGTFKLTWDLTRLEWSPYLYVMHDVSKETFTLGKDEYERLVHPDDREEARRILEDVTAGKAVEDAEYRILRPDGSVRWLRIDARVLFDADGAPYGSFGVCQDITESKNREQELNDLLRRNATLYEAIEASPIGVAVLTRDGERLVFLYVNAEFQRLTLHNSFSLHGRTLDILRPASETEAGWVYTAEALAGSKSGSFELTCLRRDSSTFIAQLDIAPVLDFPGREAVAYVLNLRDTTSDKQRAAALLQSQKMEALGQLSGGVAHEINNLLQPVIALSELGEDIAERDPVKVRRYFDVIGGSGRKARDIVRQVLTFARRDTPNAASYAIGPLISDALDLVQSGLPPGLVLRREITVNDAKAVVNATQMSQVVVNLVRNAADASESQGTVEVSLSAVDLDEAAATAVNLTPGPWLMLVVKDNGCGMDAYTVSRIFEPFFTTKPVGKGTGLGLSVVYSVVAGWGGTVRIESEVDKGTSAMVYIPIDQASAHTTGTLA